MWPLIKLMLKEEFRFHTSFSNRYGFFLFPILMFLLTVILAFVSPELFKQVTYKQMIMSLHSGLFLYGVSMGSFAFLGREYIDRRGGRVNFLISSPLLLPIKFRKTFIAFYLHDVIFYYFMVIIPLTCGLILAVPFMGYNILSVLFLSVTLFVSFIIGLAFSFFVSAIYTRDVRVFMLFIGSVGAFIITALVYFEELGLLIPSFEIFLNHSTNHIFLAAAYIFGFSVAAGLLIQEKYEVVASEFENNFPRVIKRFHRFRKYPYLLAKEYIDLIRSKSMTKIAFSFILPLLFITFISWLLRTNIIMEIEFNSVFYASMVGFFSVMIYYWLTSTDNLESFQTLPLDVPTIIRSKLIIFFVISSVISSIYIVIISLIYDELHLIGISMFVMLTTSFYIAVSTAYLTGLRTRSYLFNINVLVKFCILSALPLTTLEIIVLNLNTYWFIALTALGIASVILVISTFILYKGIDRKWATAEFT